MHACVVFDEAASNTLRGFFDDETMVKALLARLKQARIAESLVVVVSGTGLTAQAFDSNNDAYHFRTRPWGRGDLVMLLKHFNAKPTEDADRLSLKEGESTTEALADAICSLPLLDALSTNGRAAYYMVRAIASASRRTASFRRQGWRSHLSFLVPAIVDEVVVEYMQNNGIRTLGEVARPRVAAWVFGSLSRLKKKSLELPVFEGLDVSEAGKALMLLQLNVQKSDGQVYLLDDALYSASVTPALAIVLFSMAGVFTGVLSGWRGEEEVAALYAAHQAIVERFGNHVREIHELQSRYEKEARRDLESAGSEARKAAAAASYKQDFQVLVDEFDESLRELYVYRIQHPIQSNPMGAAVKIPLVPRTSILLNAEKASFADVVAPYTFIQTKHTSKSESSVKVDLAAEVGKCCLLKSCKADRALRGLVALWDGAFESFLPTPNETGGGSSEASERAPKQFWTLQSSKSYPANLIATRQPFDGVAYAEIMRNGKVKNTKMVLPRLPSTLDISFVLSSNAERIDLVLPGKYTIPITAAALDEATLQLDEGTLNETQREKWRAFRGSMRDGVKLQCLFTGGSLL
jgi:hypothetical protein